MISLFVIVVEALLVGWLYRWAMRQPNDDFGVGLLFWFVVAVFAVGDVVAFLVYLVRHWRS